MILTLLVFLPLLGALLLPLIAPREGKRSLVAALAAVAPLVALAVLLGIADRIFAGGVVVTGFSWIPSLGVDLKWRLDGLSLLFTLLVLGIGLLVILYARYYLSHSDRPVRFYSLLLLFMGAMMGVVLAENLLLLVVFWELTSVSSFLLIGYRPGQSGARKGARMALTITSAGGLSLLAAVLLIGNALGSYDLSSILDSGEALRSSPHYPLILGLFLLGVFTKSAQFPFHVWLPHAMAAPTPVSAYLHSATMVKAGVFLLARMHPVLSDSQLWFVLVSGVGMVTFLWGALLALFRHDLKGLLAYSTISHLGLITMLFGLGTRAAAVAGVFHIINHAIFKASLFMAAGIIDHETGTRDMRRINGLWKYMPHTALLAMVAAASMAGVPLLNGFLSKEMFFTEALETIRLSNFGWVVPVAATLGGAFSVAYSVRFIHDVFFNGEPIDLPKYPPHEPPRYMKVPVEILAGLCLLVGVAPALVVGPLLEVAAAATLNGPLPNFSLSVWHGINTPLIMSLVAMGGGLLLYSVRQQLFEVYALSPQPDARYVFERGIQSVIRSARKVVKLVDPGSLQRQQFLLLVMVALVMLLAMGRLPALNEQLQGTASHGGIALLMLVLGSLGAVGTVVWHRYRLTALLLLSIVGLVVSVAFARLSAPDLALTQLAVEVVTILLLMLSIHFLPKESRIQSSLWRAMRDLAVASVIGVGTALLALYVMLNPGVTISRFFLDNAIPGGGGRNVVNVILVDFRALDTLFEVTVLAVAALGIYALLENLKLDTPTGDRSGRPWARELHPMVLTMISRPLLPIAVMVAFYFLLRGHNAPGGGFVAGLITAVALVLQYVANGTAWMQRRVPHDYHPLVSWGVLLAGVTGIASMLLGHPFLTSGMIHLHVPVVGEVHLVSAMIFDLGVFLAVVGTTLLMLANLGRLGTPEEEA